MASVDKAGIDASKTVLLTLGRLPVALDIARAFHLRGWRVIVAETLAWHPCRLSTMIAVCHEVVSPVADHRRYRRQLLDIIARENVTLVVPVSEEILYVSRIQDDLPEHVTLLTMNSSLLDQLHDKWLFARWAMGNDIPVPATARADSEAALALLENHACVIKPRLSCSGVGVVFCEHGNKPAPALLTEDHVVQVKMTDERCSSFVMASHGKCLLIVTYQSLLDSGSVAVRFERIATPFKIKQFNEIVVKLMNFSGMISFDFMADHENKWRAIECNPRATSGLHLVSSQQIVAGFLAMENPALIDRIAEPFSNYAAPSDPGVLPEGTKRQEFWSALTETQNHLLHGKFSSSLWRELFHTPDVSWLKRDWKPCVLMPFATWQLLWLAIRQRKPVSQVAMLDVGWYHALSDQLEERDHPVITVSSEVPADYAALVAEVTFGTEGLRYQRHNVVEQLDRFHEPVFITAHIHEELVGVYVLDKRQLLWGVTPVTGYYRSVLVVAEAWQGMRIGISLTDAAMVWIDEQSQLLNEPVLSYGCIDTTNTRSMTLLEKQGAACAGDISMFMMYRQWPTCRTQLIELTDSTEHSVLLGDTHADCSWRDATPASTPILAFVDEQGIRISACVSLSEFGIVEMGFWATWLTRLLVKPWPPARKRFDPSRFRSVVFSQIAVRPDCEKDWADFVSAILARYEVHFGTVYANPQSNQFNQLLRKGWFARRLHSPTGGIRLMSKIHSVASVAAVEELNETNGLSADEASDTDSRREVKLSSQESTIVPNGGAIGIRANVPWEDDVESEDETAFSEHHEPDAITISSAKAHALYPVDS